MKKFFVYLLFILMLTGCGGAAAEQAAQSPAVYSFTDDLGRSVQVESCERVAALIGSFADVWCLAGGKDSLVAAADDTWTSFDLGLDESVVHLGSIKEPSLEHLLAAEPDLVLASCNTDSNLRLRETLENAGITVAYFDVQSFYDYHRMLQICTDLTGCPENFTLYGEAVEEEIEAARAKISGSPTVLCMRATGSSCKVKGSTDFLLGEMLADLGCVNVADGSSLLEELSLEAIIAAEPEYIFVVLQGADPGDAMETLEKTLLTNPAWSSLKAVKEGRFHCLEHELYNLKPNARWGEAYEKLAEILYGP